MDFDLEGFLPYRLSVAAAHVSKDFARLYPNRAALTTPEWRILAHLHQAGTVSVRDIHRRTDLEKPVISRTTERLEQEGLVNKTVNASDRRLVELSLSDKGRRTAEAVIPEAIAFQSSLRQMLGEDADVFERCLKMIIEQGDGEAP